MRFALRPGNRPQPDRVLRPSRAREHSEASGAQYADGFGVRVGDGGRLGPDEAVDRVGGGAMTGGGVLLFLGA